MASNTSLLQSTVGNILGLAATGAEQTAAAKGQGYTAQGDAAEQAAYTQAALIATQNAHTEEMAGKLEQVQADRTVQKTIGTQKADIAGAGFQASGTFMSGLQESYRQGLLTKQLIGVQTGLTASGYYTQAAAATGEAAAAGYANNAALELQKADTTAAKTSAANQAAETAALMGYLGSTGGLSTPEGLLATSVLNSGGQNPSGKPDDLTGPMPGWTNTNGMFSFNSTLPGTEYTGRSVPIGGVNFLQPGSAKLPALAALDARNPTAQMPRTLM